MNSETHFKMYKAKKRWLVAGMAVAAFYLGNPVMTQAKADSNTPDQTTATKSMVANSAMSSGITIGSASMSSTSAASSSSTAEAASNISSTPSSVAPVPSAASSTGQLSSGGSAPIAKSSVSAVLSGTSIASTSLASGSSSATDQPTVAMAPAAMPLAATVNDDTTIGEQAAVSDIENELSNQGLGSAASVGESVLATLTDSYQGAGYTGLTAAQQASYTQTLTTFTDGIKAAENDLLTTTNAGLAGNYAMVTPADQVTGLSVATITSRFAQSDALLDQAFADGYNLAAFGDSYLYNPNGIDNLDASPAVDEGYYGIAIEVQTFLKNVAAGTSYATGPNLTQILGKDVTNNYPMPNALADREQLFNTVMAQLTPVYVAGGENGVRITAENAAPISFDDYASQNPSQASVKFLDVDYASGIYQAGQTSFKNDSSNIYPKIETQAESDVHAGLSQFSAASWTAFLNANWSTNATTNPLSVTILQTIGTDMVIAGQTVFQNLINAAKTAYSNAASYATLTNSATAVNPYAGQNELATMYQNILTAMVSKLNKPAVKDGPTGLTVTQQHAINDVETLSPQQELGADQLGLGGQSDPTWIPYYATNASSTTFAGDVATLKAIVQNAYLDALGVRPASAPTTTGTQPATAIGAWDDGILFAEQQLNSQATDANDALAADPNSYPKFAAVLAPYSGTDYDYTGVVEAAYDFQRSKLGQLTLNYVRKLDSQSMTIDGKSSVGLWGFVPDTLGVNTDGQSLDFTDGTTQTTVPLDLPPVDGVVYTAIPSGTDNPAGQLTGDRTATGYYENITPINSTLYLKAANTLAEVTVPGQLTNGQLTLTVPQIATKPTFATNSATDVQTTGAQVFDWTTANLPTGWEFADGNLTYTGSILNPQGTTLALTDRVGDTLSVTIGFTNTQTAIFNFVDSSDDNQSLDAQTDVPTDVDRTVSGTFNQPIVTTFSNGETLQTIINQLVAKHYQLVTDLSSLPLTYDEDDLTTQTFTIAFSHAQIVVTPGNPGQPGTPIDPNDPTGPLWPAGTDLASLQATGQRTIEYVDADTSQPIKVAQTNNGQVIQQVTFTRHAIVDEVTGQILGYDTTGDGTVNVSSADADQAWLPKTAAFEAVTSPDLSQYGYVDPHDVSATAPTGAANVASATAMPNDQLVVTIAYDHQLIPVTPGQQLVPGTPISANNPNQPTWPSEVATTNLTKTVTRIIHYVDADDSSKSVAPDATDSVSYNRTAVIDAVTGQWLGYAPDPITGRPTQTSADGGWSLSSPSDTLPAVASPDLTGQGYLTPDQPTVAEQVIASDYTGSDQLSVTVTYPHNTKTATPDQPGQPGQPIDPKNPDGPKWPAGTAASDLSQTQTRTINYLDQQTGVVVAQPVQQQVSFARTAIVDQVTGALLGYDTVGNGKVTTTDPSQAWVLTSPSDQLAAVVSPDLSAKGYLPASPAQVAEVIADSATGNQSQSIDVYYSHATTPVTPTQPEDPGQPIDPANPNGPKWPAGTDANALTKTITRTINYLDQQTGAVVSSAIKQTVTLTRTAIVDRATGALLGYDLDGNGTVDTTDGDAAWQADGTDVLAAVTSPDLTGLGYQPASVAQVAAQTIADNYTGDANLVVNVLYGHRLQPVTPAQPELPGQPINPSDPNGPKWPDGLSKTDLTKTITRTINYLDAQTQAVVSPQVNQAVTLTRTAIVDQVTGKIVGYDTTGDGNANVTDAAQAWVIKGTDQLAAVTSPDLSDLGYQLADPTAVAAQTIATTYTGTTQITINVYYDHQTTTATPTQPGVPGQPINPNDPNGPKWPVGTAASDLSKMVTRTINYLDRQTGHSVATAVTQQVTFDRTAIIDQVTGQLLGYDTTGNGQIGTTNADEAWRIDGSNQLAAVVSPDLVADGYQIADPQSVNALTLTNNYSGEATLAVDVYYDHATLPVTPTTPGQPGQPINPSEPNGPKWPTGTAASDLTETVTRTINYLDQQTGQVVAKPVVQQVTYDRTAIIDQVTGQLLGYDTTGDGNVDTTNGQQAWVSVGTPVLAAVTSPDLSAQGYQSASTKQVTAQTISADYKGEMNLVVNVYYDHATTSVTPSWPEQPGQPIDPSQPNGPKWPQGTAADDLTQTVTRTINYLDRQTGLPLATPVVQTVSYRRTAIVDRVTGQLLGYDINGDGQVDTDNGAKAWQADGSTELVAVVSPNLQGLGYSAASQYMVDELPIPADYRGARQLTVNVYYDHQVVFVTPVHPGNPGEPINPADPKGPKWPAATSLDQLTKTITRTITYLNETTGATVANPVVQTVTYHRTALVDAVTGQLLGYDLNGDGVVDTTDALNAWVVDGTDTLGTVTSPQLDGFGEPSLPVIGEQVIPGSYTGDLAMHVIVYYSPLTQPVNPVEPTQPDQPGEPSTPVEPTQPSEPSTPIEPTQPSKPSTPVEPTQPAQPSRPSEPARPVEPAQPSASVEPNVPVEAVPVQTRMHRFNHQSQPTPLQRARLPKTDAQRHGLLATIWLAVLSLFGLGSLRRKKNVK